MQVCHVKPASAARWARRKAQDRCDASDCPDSWVTHCRKRVPRSSKTAGCSNKNLKKKSRRRDKRPKNLGSCDTGVKSDRQADHFGPEQQK